MLKILQLMKNLLMAPTGMETYMKSFMRNHRRKN